MCAQHSNPRDTWTSRDFMPRLCCLIKWSLRTALYGLVALGAGCADNQQGSDPISQMLQGWTLIEPDKNRVVMASEAGQIGVWDCNSGRFRSDQLGSRELRFFSANRFSGEYVAIVCNGQDDHGDNRGHGWKSLLRIDSESLGILARHRLALAQSSVRILGADTIAVLCPDETDEQSDLLHFEAWRLKGDSAESIGSFEDPRPPSEVHSILALSENMALLHKRCLPEGCDTPQVQINEIALCDVHSLQILRSTSTAVQASHGGSLRLSPGGKYFAVYDLNLVEVRQLPSLQVVGKLKRPERSQRVLELAVSADGSLIAFGAEELWVWNVHTGASQILDRLNQDQFAAMRVRKQGKDPYTAMDIEYATYKKYSLADVAFPLQGHILHALTRDGTYVRWDIDRRKCLKRTRIPETARSQ